METSTLYRLMSWLSPAFPVGAYSYSHGLEYAVDESLVYDRVTLQDWIETILRYGTGRVDSVLFNAVYRSYGDELDELKELASAMRGTAELALESHSQGKAFLTTIHQGWDHEVSQSRQTPYVIAVAETSKVNQIPVDQALTAYLHAFASNMVSAGIRLIPLGQTDGQRIIASLEDVIGEVVENASHTSIDDLGSSTPMVDWTSMQHETQRTRLFRS